MTWNTPFKDMANSNTISLLSYAVVAIGLALYFFCIFSDVYNSSSSYSSLFSSPSPSQELNASHMANGNVLLAPNTTRPKNRLVKPIWEVPPAGSKMPHLRTFRLSKKLVQQRVKDNIIIITFGNYAFMDLILNWAKHLTDMGIDNFLVGAMDTKLLEALYWKGIPVYDMGSKMSTIDVGWGSPDFQKMGREKVILIDAILPFGFEILMSDADMVWLKNPLPYLARFSDADILTSTDQLIPTVVDDNLDFCEEVHAHYNVGMFHWRPSKSSKRLAKEWKKMVLADPNIWEQQAFNDVIRRQLGPSVDRDSQLNYAFDGKLKLGCLPASIFCTGHTFFIQKMYQQLGLEPYAAHATHQFYSGLMGKHHRFREAKLFHDPPEYYDVLGGFLTFKPSIPKNLLLDGEHSIATHFALVNHQIVQIRTAFAVASLLNRTLVMPKIWCRMDSVYLSRPSDLIGSIMRQPFICPLDHVFQVNVMVNEMPEEEFGPSIKIREFSFFDNPSMPQKVKESWLDVDLCQEGLQGCQVSNTKTQTGVLKFPRNSSEEVYKTVFSSFKDVKVIQFSSMQDAFLGFTDKSREEKFRKRMKAYIGRWCCVDNHNPGHIYFDIYWDEKPDWKPEPPKTPEEDHPPL